MKTAVFKTLTPSLILMASLFASAPASGRVLDDFDDNVKTGWADVLLGGSVLEANGQFTITTANQNGAIFTASTKTTESFTIEDGRTLEFRVDLISASAHDESIAVLIWVPIGSSIANLQGYGLAKGANDFLFSKALNQYFYATSPNPRIKNNNITLVLRLTGSGANVIINGRILDKDDNNRVIYEYTVTDTPASETQGPESRPASYVGMAGNFALLNYKDSGQPESTLVFDNAQAFDMAAIVLDDFNDNTKTGWSDILNGGTVTEANQQFELRTAPLNQTIFTSSRKTSQTFRIQDGGRVEFSVDVISSVVDNDAYAVLAYVPAPGGVGTLTAYHLAQGGDQILAGKQFDRWWFSQPFVGAQSNVRLIQTYTGEGASVRVSSRIENLAVGVNDPARILIQNEFLDTAGVDPGISPGGDSGGAYTNAEGTFLLYAFYAGPGTGTGADVVYDNARVNYAVPGALNISPSVSDLSPQDGANFVGPATTIDFTVNDDKTIPLANIELFLNGTRHTNGSPGVTIGGSPNSRSFSFSGLAAGIHYNARIRVVDSDNNVATTLFTFDTFVPEVLGVTPTVTDTLVIESEDFNFFHFDSAGHYVDFELMMLMAEGTSDPLFAYNGVQGTAETDFHDTRATSVGGESARHRPDPVGNGQTTDILRQKYIDAGGPANQFYDYMIRDIADGEWLNYTKTFPSGGAYRVYLRQAQYLLPVSLVTLERVTGDSSLPNQTTVPLGSFIGQASGLEQYRNIPLTDGVGNPLVVSLSGLTTLRVTQRQTGNDDAVLRQNYLVFVPAAAPGTLLPFVSSVTPAPGDLVSSITPTITATIVNRDTTVAPGSIVLQFNGVTVPATVTPDATGATVSYAISPLPLPNVLYTNTLIFQDSGGVFQTNRWAFSFNYNYLRSSNSLPVGTLNALGWAFRTVQTNGPTLGNSLARAEQQLAIPPTIPAEFSATGFIPILNFNETGGGAGNFGDNTTVPGMTAGDYNNIAMEAYGYLELTAGAHRFGVVSDDGFQLRSGSSLADPNAVAVGMRDGGTFNGTFDFVVQASGLYPARLVWYENGGGASFELFSVALSDPNARTLLNDTNTVGSIKVWAPIRLASAATVNGPFTFEPSAVVDPIAKTVTVATGGATRFYLLHAPFSPRITNVNVTGGNIVLTWE